MENFSRPRKASMRQPVSGMSAMSGGSRPVALPTPSEESTHMIDNHAPPPSPWQRPRRPSASSNISSSTWASTGLSPTSADFPDVRGSGRVRNAPGPPPVTATRPPFGLSNRADSSGSGSVTGGAPPWLGGDELRSSFRSQLTASSVPGTAGTERSSVLTKETSATSVDANVDNDEEPSIEDLMGMYEEGFDDDEDEDDNHLHHHQRAQEQLQQNYPKPQPEPQYRPYTPQLTQDLPSLAPEAPEVTSPVEIEQPVQSPSPTLAESEPDEAPLPAPGRRPSRPHLAVDSEHDEMPEPSMPATNLDAEIRKSRLIFTSPAFIASVPHLNATSTVDLDDDKTGEKRDSGKSLESEPSVSPTPLTSSPPMSNLTNSPLPSPAMNMAAKEDPNKYPDSCLPPDTGPAEPEVPGSRDRYGFKKESQNVNRKQYDAWDKGYSEYLSRREKKWKAYLKEHSLMTDRPNRFPPPSPKTKRFVRKGIPPEWRGAAWFYYAGGPAIMAKHSGLYAKLLHMKAKRVDVEAIERDLHRTFPDNISFKPPKGTQFPGARDSTSSGEGELLEEPPIIASLRRVLFAFSIYNHHIGYCQSLNFIAGMLLLFVETEEKCFWLLNVITHIYLPGTHEMSLEGSQVDLSVLMAEIRDTMPAVWDKIGGEFEGPGGEASRPSTSKSLRKVKAKVGRRKDEGPLTNERLPPITLCMTAWFMSCFVGTLPVETTLRVWDVFFYEGSKTLFRIALAVFKLGESEIKALADPMEMFQLVQAMPRRMIDANELMEACFKRRNGFGHLTQMDIDERRQERRDLAAADKGQIRAKSQDPESRSKASLFGAKKKRDMSRPRA